MNVRIGSRWLLGALLVVVLATAAACGGSDDDGGGEAASQEDQGGGDASAAHEVAVDAESGYLGSEGGGGEFAAAPSSDIPAVGPSIIKTADVAIEVPSGDFRTALQDLTATAGRFGGFVVSTTTAGDESRTGSIVLRVPSEDFEAALASIEDLGKVEREEISGRDVTQEFVDLEARLRNLQAQESVLLGLMKKAQTIPASIRVQNALSSVQLDIEQIRGRLNFLEDRASMSTIAVGLTEHGAPAPAEPSMLSKAWGHAVDVTEAIVYALVVSLGFVLPLGLLAGIIYLVIRLAMRSMRPKLGSGGAE
jgi:Domain of unknown function (DUF4349)